MKKGLVLLTAVIHFCQGSCFCPSRLRLGFAPKNQNHDPCHDLDRRRLGRRASNFGKLSSSDSLFDALPLSQPDQTLSILKNIDLNGGGLVLALPLLALLVSLTSKPPARIVTGSALHDIVRGSFLERNRSLGCVYKASRDGWSALDFHSKVDGAGSGVVVALSTSGKVFGGYNPVGWRSTDDYYTSNSAFLWCLRGQQVVKLPILTGGNAAVFDYATGGPCFSSDLQIGPPEAAVLGGFAGPNMENLAINAGNLRQGKSSVGITYSWDDAWPARGSFRLVDLEVYCRRDR
jgi:hypothetical protein